jgi:rod shape-determining protein MreB and related proteins
MFSKDIGIDLGTANILIYKKGEGIVLNEPSVLAIDDETKEILAVGNDAKRMLGRTPGKIKAIRPLKDGVIADFQATEMLLEYLIKKIKVKNLFLKPKILICCPSNVTQVEKNAIREAAEKMGARKVIVEEEPKVAALGAGLDIAESCGNMVIDIGGGTTDIAVLSLGDIVVSESIKVAGNAFDSEIIKYIKNKYNLFIGETSAEEIKKKIGFVYDLQSKEKMTVKGRDLVTGLPLTIIVTANEIRGALSESAMQIVSAVKHVLEQTPPELSSDIINSGIVLTGGGSLIMGLPELLSEELKVPVRLSDSPLTCVADGTGIMLENYQF